MNGLQRHQTVQITCGINISVRCLPSVLAGSPCAVCSLHNHTQHSRGHSTSFLFLKKPNINQTFVNWITFQTLFFQLLLCRWNSPSAKTNKQTNKQTKPLYNKVGFANWFFDINWDFQLPCIQLARMGPGSLLGAAWHIGSCGYSQWKYGEESPRWGT